MSRSTSKTRRMALLGWLLCGAAFLVVVMSAGCATDSATTHAPRAPMPAARFDAGTVESARPLGPKVNIFGELDGIAAVPAQRAHTGALQQHTFIDDGFDGDVAVSPDGQWIVFSSTRHSEAGDIYLQRVGGTSVIRLTDDDARDAFPTFSSDGRSIAFSSTRSGSWDIYVMDADGRNVRQVTSAAAQEIHPSFSPGGSQLVFCSMPDRGGQWELWTVDLRTDQKRMIGYGLFPEWSADRSVDRIAFQRARARGSRWFSLWTVELIDGEARRPTEVAVSSNAAIVSPVWSPDGTKLAFSTIVEPARASGDKSGVQQDIWTISADGTNRQRVTDGSGTYAAPFWAADNRIYFVSDRGGSECIWSAQAGTSGIAAASKEQTEPKPEAVGATDPRELPQ